jgi:hypothetical protein
VVAAAGRVMGLELPVRCVPLGSQVPLLPPTPAGMLGAMETYEDLIDMSGTAPAFGVQLTGPDEYLRRTFLRQSDSSLPLPASRPECLQAVGRPPIECTPRRPALAARNPDGVTAE